MAKINKEELTHLEQLANINIDKDQEWKFLEKLDNIVEKLDELNQFDTTWTDKSTDNDNPLRTISGTKDFEWKKEIIDNVKHDVVNNSIVIKSALSN